MFATMLFGIGLLKTQAIEIRFSVPHFTGIGLLSKGKTLVGIIKYVRKHERSTVFRKLYLAVEMSFSWYRQHPDSSTIRLINMTQESNVLKYMMAMMLAVHQIPTVIVIRHEQEAPSMLCIRSIAVNYSCFKVLSTVNNKQMSRENMCVVTIFLLSTQPTQFINFEI